MLRAWVFKALCAVIIQKTYSNLYLKDHLDELPAKDRGLATRIFYGTIQNYAFCQSVWKKYAKNKVNAKMDVLLTMSVYQLLFLDKVPQYAVVNDAVSIAKKISFKLGGFVNAVLHKIDKEKIELPQDPVEKLAVEYSVPLWLIRLWNSQYGYDKTKQMAKASVQLLPVYVRRNPLKISKEEFEADSSITKTDHDLYIFNGSVAAHPFYKEGKMSVQDEGSYEIAKWAAPNPGDNVLDTCAAPGTKSMAMAEIMENKGHIDALELHEHRAKLIDQDGKRLGIDIVQSHVQDSTNLEDYPEYDSVLCDVPCSGYGVLARKPDLKLNIKPEDMDALIPLQQSILSQGSNHVKKNGKLVYSTCTINKKENEKQVEKFLKDHPNFELIKEKTMFADEGVDGFYMALMERKD